MATSNCCTECGCVLIKECDIYNFTPLKGKNNIFEKKDIIIDVHVLKVKPLIPGCYDALCAELEDKGGIDELSPQSKELVASMRTFIAKWTYVFWLERYGDSEHSEVGLVDGSYDDGARHVSSSKLEKKIIRETSIAEQYGDLLKATDLIKACQINNNCKPCGDNNSSLTNLERL